VIFRKCQGLKAKKQPAGVPLEFWIEFLCLGGWRHLSQKRRVLGQKSICEVTGGAALAGRGLLQA